MRATRPSFFQIVTRLFTFLFLFTNIAFAYRPESNLWQERKKSFEVASLPLSMPGFSHGSAISSDLQKNLINEIPQVAAAIRSEKARNPLVASMPSSFFSHVDIKESHRGSSAQTVVLIEDVHQIQEAQQHISAALKSAGSSNGSNAILVGLEAANGGFLFDTYKSLSNQDKAELVANSFLKSADISGPAHAGFTYRKKASDRGLLFWGVDGSDLYRANVAAYKNSSKIKAKTLSQLEALEREIAAQKETQFNSQLAAFDSELEAHRKGTLSMGQYIKMLIGHGATTSLNVDVFLQAYEAESTLDFANVERERSKVVEQLVKAMKEQEVKTLMAMSMAYQEGTLTFADFYGQLRRLCQKHAIDLKETPAFDGYIQYVLLADSVDASKLFTEVNTIEQNVTSLLAKTAAEKKLMTLSRQVYLAGLLADLSLTSDQWNLYQENRSLLSNEINMAAFEAFYTAADQRNHAMVNNLMSHAQFEKSNLSMLVAGGYHTLGLVEILKKKKISVAVVTPKISSVEEESEAHYLSVFDREKSSLEQIFAGQKLFLGDVVAGGIRPLLPDAPNPVVPMAHYTQALAPNPLDTNVLNQLGLKVEEVEVVKENEATIVTSKVGPAESVTVVAPSVDELVNPDEVVIYQETRTFDDGSAAKVYTKVTPKGIWATIKSFFSKFTGGSQMLGVAVVPVLAEHIFGGLPSINSSVLMVGFWAAAILFSFLIGIYALNAGKDPQVEGRLARLPGRTMVVLYGIMFAFGLYIAINYGTAKPLNSVSYGFFSFVALLYAAIFLPVLKAVEGGASSLPLSVSSSNLAKVAAQMASPKGGVLAADESVSTAGKRLGSDSVKLPNTPENRQEMRRVLLTTPGLKDAGISAVILDRDTLTNTIPDGKTTIVDYLISQGIVPGLKTDEGLEKDPDHEDKIGAMISKDRELTKLPALLKQAVEFGLGFTKYRQTFSPDDPNVENIEVNAKIQAKQAKMTQEAGLVPMVEPEVVYDGSDGSPATHNLKTSYDTTTKVLDISFKALEAEGVALEGLILKTSMILAGKNAPAQTDAGTVGFETLKGLLKTVPANVAAIVFLSGGQGDEQAMANLDAVIKASKTRFVEARDAAAAELLAEGKLSNSEKVGALKETPWPITYSFGRGLQARALKAWGGKPENFEAAQKAMKANAQEAQLARQGNWKKESVKNPRLAKVAAQMASPKGGVLAADESVSTAGKRLGSDSVKLPNTPENRQEMRRVLLTTPGLKDAGISAVILDRDTLTNTIPDGKTTIVDYLISQGIVPGLKTDEGLEKDPDHEDKIGAMISKDRELTKLPALLKQAVELGLGFTKYRQTFSPDDPNVENIEANAKIQAKQAKMTQEAGLVPMVEPEVVYDGSDGSPATHNLKTSYDTTTKVLDISFKALEEEGVALEGLILKTSMILAGKNAPAQTDAATVGFETLKGLLKTVPAEVAAIVFLSGGQGDEQAMANLDAVIKWSKNGFAEARDAAAAELLAEGKFSSSEKVSALKETPWPITYSFGRGLQARALKAWGGKAENFEAAQNAMKANAQEAQLARQGNWKKESVKNPRLAKVAAQMASPTGGVLAADESVSTAGKRLGSDSVGLPNTPENRQEMRRVLLTTPGLKDAGISAVILDRDTLTNTTPDGKTTIVNYLISQGIVPGLKTDEGLEKDPDHGDKIGAMISKDRELTKLPALLKQAVEFGLGFTKYRQTFSPDDPNVENIEVNAKIQAKQAKMTQEAGLVPMVEPEVVYDGSDGSPATHNLKTSYDTTTQVLDISFRALEAEGVALEGMILKTSMILAGINAAKQTDPETVGYQTLKGLLKTVPADVAAVVFLSGGQSDDQATANLDAIVRASRDRFLEAQDEAVAELRSEGKWAEANKLEALKETPWPLTYSFGRGLQARALKAWGGKAENFASAQKEMRANAEEAQRARQGFLTKTPLAIPSQFVPALNGFGLKGAKVYATSLDGKTVPSDLLSNPLNAFALSGSISQALGSIFFAGRDKVKEIADGNAVAFAEESIEKFTKANEKVAVVVLSDEGARDDSYALEIGSIYIDGKKISFKGLEDLMATLERLRNEGFTILYFIGDALEKTNGLVVPEAATEATDSNALFSFYIETPDTRLGTDFQFLNDDNNRIGGISSSAPEDAGVTPFDLPSVALRKIAGANAKKEGLLEGTPEYSRFITNYINSTIVLTLGPRSAKQAKAYEKSTSSHRHQAIIDDAKEFQKKYPGLKTVFPGDGDLGPRIVASLGLNLDGYHMVVFGRSGSTEARAARITVLNAPNARFVHTYVSEKNTASAYNEENAYGYTEEEAGRFQKMGVPESVYRTPQTSKNIVGAGVLSLTSVTGASKSQYSPSFASEYRRVTVKKDATGAGIVTASSILSTPQGNFLVHAVLESNDVAASQNEIKTKIPAAKEYWNQIEKNKSYLNTALVGFFYMAITFGITQILGTDYKVLAVIFLGISALFVYQALIITYAVRAPARKARLIPQLIGAPALPEFKFGQAMTVKGGRLFVNASLVGNLPDWNQRWFAWHEAVELKYPWLPEVVTATTDIATLIPALLGFFPKSIERNLVAQRAVEINHEIEQVNNEEVIRLESPAARAIYELMPSGRVIGDETGSQFRRTMIKRMNNYLKPQKRSERLTKLVWDVLFSRAGDSANMTFQQAAQYRGSKKNQVFAYIVTPASLEEAKSELPILLDNDDVGVTLIVGSLGLNAEEQEAVDAMLSRRTEISFINVEITEQMQDANGVYLYDKLLEAASAEIGDSKSPVTQLAQGAYSDVNFVAIPKGAPFTASDALARIMNILMNIGALYRFVPVTTGVEALRLAQQMA